MIEAVTNDTEAVGLGVDGRAWRRLVSAEDAEQMRTAAGKWFKVQRSGEAENVRVAVGMLRKKLPAWYGGEWEVCAKAGEVYVRSVPLS